MVSTLPQWYIKQSILPLIIGGWEWGSNKMGWGSNYLNFISSGDFFIKLSYDDWML